jgi:hypothetical protein
MRTAKHSAGWAVEMHYLTADNRDFLLALYQKLKSSETER